MSSARRKAVTAPWEQLRQSRHRTLADSLRDRLVADEGELAAVRRPRRDIDRSLSAEQLGEHFDLPALGRHEAQDHLLILWMALHRLFVGENHDPFAIG